MNSQQDYIAELESSIAQLKDENKKLREENASLKAQLAEKDKDVKEIKMVLRTPDWIREERLRRQRESHKQLEDEKRKGTSRKTPERTDETKEVKLSKCPDCKGKLSKTVEIRERYIEDVQPVKSTVIKYRIHRKYCKKCKKIVEPKILQAFPNFRFGLFLCLYIIALNKGLSLPLRRIKELLLFTYSLHISVGEIENIIDKVAEEFGPEYENMKKQLKQMKSIYADETSWYINGKLNWLWIFLSEKIAVYHIQNSRGKKVPAKMLKGFRGILISDFYNAYDQGKINQKCLVHLLRDIFNWKKVKYFNSKELRKFALRLKKIILDAIYTEEKSKHNRVKFEKKILRLISKNCKDGEIKRMNRRLEKHLNSLFTFLEYPVEFSNNKAERVLRPCVVARKISYGSRSKLGAYNFAVLKSVFETCKINEKNFFEYGMSYLQDRITSES